MSHAKRQAGRLAFGLRAGAVLGFVLAALCGMQPAHAFYPLGAYNSSGVLTYATWPLGEMDTNGDGDVQQGEGIPLIFESGVWGFNDSEIATVLRGLQTWQNVNTAYVGFRMTGKTPDPLELELGLDAGAVDFINYVAFEFSDAGSPDPSALPDGTVGFVLITFTLEDTTITVDGLTYPISGPQIIETDYVFDGTVYRDNDSIIPDFITLQGAATTVGGLGLGLSQSPLINAASLIYDPDAPTVLLGVKEPRVVALPDSQGNLSLVGTTSSMQLNLAVVYDDTSADSRVDLAPDDIAGISFLYPRASQANFANIQHEARSRSRRGAPTRILEGAHIIAYCDVDNDQGTRPVPFVDTLTGLYELNPARRGFFDLKGIFKQLQTGDGTLFEPTYILSCAPFDPLGTEDLSSFDSTNGGPFAEGPNPLSFATLFSAEVFNEGGNLLGLANVPGGTPLRFDSLRNRFVSAETGLSLTQMLPGRTPMFGDPETTCPYLIVVGETAALTGASTEGTKFLRDVRDRYLMQSGPGLVLVDAYYHAAPAVSEFMRRHAWATTAVAALAWTFEWVLGHRYALALLGLVLPVVIWVGRRRPRAAGAAAATLLALVLASPAPAQEQPLSTKQLVSLSNDIVTGEVTSAESRFDEKNRIVTDVTVNVGDTIKGRLNKGGRVSFQVQGGRVGSIVTYSPSLPQFNKGENVVLFLKSKRDGGTTVTAGRRGKLEVEADPVTKKKVVVTPSPLAPPKPLFESTNASAAAKAKAAPKKKAANVPAALQEQRIPLEDYKEQLRRIVREEEASR